MSCVTNSIPVLFIFSSSCPCKSHNVACSMHLISFTNPGKNKPELVLFSFRPARRCGVFGDVWRTKSSNQLFCEPFGYKAIIRHAVFLRQSVNQSVIQSVSLSISLHSAQRHGAVMPLRIAAVHTSLCLGLQRSSTG